VIVKVISASRENTLFRSNTRLAEAFPITVTIVSLQESFLKGFVPQEDGSSHELPFRHTKKDQHWIWYHNRFHSI